MKTRELKVAGFLVAFVAMLSLAGCNKKVAKATPPAAPPAPTASLAASPNVIQRGQTTTLSWQTTNSTDITIAGLRAVPTSGSRSVTPNASTTYTLESCKMQSASFTAPVAQPTLGETWQRTKSKMTAWRLQQHPELVETAMNLVFQIERETVTSCEMPSETDTALLLIAKSHEGS